MQQLLQGIQSYIQSWQHLLSFTAVAISLILACCHQHLWVVASPLVALALLFALPTILPMFGL